MEYFLVPGWEKFQHYKHRNPVWIKLYCDLFRKQEYMELSYEAKGLLMMVWILASEHDGKIPANENKLRFAFRDPTFSIISLKPLVAAGYLEDASNVLATGYQPATPETEKSREETEESVGQARLVIDLLNEKTCRAYRHTAANLKKAKARLSEGYTLEDFALVFAAKVREWGADPKMAEYLRPDTLLGTKFDSYLQSAKIPVAKDPNKLTPAEQIGSLW